MHVHELVRNRWKTKHWLEYYLIFSIQLSIALGFFAPSGILWICWCKASNNNKQPGQVNYFEPATWPVHTTRSKPILQGHSRGTTTGTGNAVQRARRDSGFTKSEQEHEGQSRRMMPKMTLKQVKHHWLSQQRFLQIQVLKNHSCPATCTQYIVLYTQSYCSCVDMGAHCTTVATVQPSYECW